jgi:hypothetical protein
MAFEAEEHRINIAAQVVEQIARHRETIHQVLVSGRSDYDMDLGLEFVIGRNRAPFRHLNHRLPPANMMMQGMNAERNRVDPSLCGAKV